MENKTEKKEKLPKRAYYVSSPEDNTVAVAMDIEVDGNTIRWFDTVKERVMIAKEIKPDENGSLTFIRAEEEGGGSYSFSPMTMELYERIKGKLFSPKDYTNLEDLLAALEETKKNAW